MEVLEFGLATHSFRSAECRCHAGVWIGEKNDVQQRKPGICSRAMYAMVSESLYKDILSELEEGGMELPAGVEDGIRYELRFLSRK